VGQKGAGDFAGELDRSEAVLMQVAQVVDDNADGDELSVASCFSGNSSAGKKERGAPTQPECQEVDATALFLV
jgi:hypothetical protein